ncbi:Thiol-disulfide isomerase or thioredoxin [Pedobacter steynii]|uniref:Thiol-disulfide isomerase or thioredoxin n=1 Tax=Pedobacter steynii TaxID=430522 RepID=A0A1G9UPS2_9SPHI|nr:TlpA disulfide reductase family protein [Pedobacter steynii]NQX40834.1 TlpA family protein disulfide reductase [Pedobacter steynii]SDM61837.1 Thiol-disulfide isomerase or thioredoxin [Pedobacter steynii]
MKSILNLSLVGFAFLILSFNNGNKDKDTATVITIDHNEENKRLSFYYHDSLSNGHPVTISNTQKKIQIHVPTLLFETSARQIPFLIYPGEKINIRYAGTDSLSLYVNGNDQRTNELNFFRKLVKETGNIYYVFDVRPYHKKTQDLRSFHQLEKTINHMKNVRLKFLTDYAKKRPVSHEFTKIALNSIKSTAFRDSLILTRNNRALLGKDVYEKGIRQKFLTLKNIGYEPYQIYQMACVECLSMATSNAGFYYTINDRKKFESTFFSALNNFDGKTKDFLITKAILSAHQADLNISKEVLKKYNEQCSAEDFKKLIKYELARKNQPLLSKTKDNLLAADGKTIRTLEQTISESKGKLIILDIWASWCMPCREETPYLIALKKKYQHRNVVFKSISIDKNVSDWIKAGKEDGLNGNSFLLLDFDQSRFKKAFKIDLIPRYLLIDQNGKMVNDNVPRPSDPKLALLIDRYLK